MARREASASPPYRRSRFLIINNRGEQVGAAEVRPQGFGHVNFGVSDLPEQKIADPHFTARANEQIGIRQIRRVKMPLDVGFGDAPPARGLRAGICRAACERHLPSRPARHN